MTYRKNVNMLNGQVVGLQYSTAEQQMTYVTDSNEFAVVSCLRQQMAERVAQKEGVHLTILH